MLLFEIEAGGAGENFLVTGTPRLGCLLGVLLSEIEASGAGESFLVTGTPRLGCLLGGLLSEIEASGAGENFLVIGTPRLGCLLGVQLLSQIEKDIAFFFPQSIIANIQIFVELFELFFEENSASSWQPVLNIGAKNETSVPQMYVGAAPSIA